MVVAAFMREDVDLILWCVGGLAAVLSLYLLLRNNFPRWAKALSWPVRGCWFVLVLVLVRGPRWTWRQAWRNEHGESRGPFTRLGEALRRWIRAALAPQFAATFDAIEANRHAAREQHDDQNHKLAAMDGRLDNIDGRLTGIEELVTAPRLKRLTTTTVEEIPNKRSTT